MEFVVNSCKEVKRKDSKGKEYTAYQLNLIARRTVKAGGLSQVKATSVFFMNSEKLAEGTKVNLPLDRCSIRQSQTEDGKTFTWVTINGLNESNAAQPAAAPAKTGATV